VHALTNDAYLRNTTREIYFYFLTHTRTIKATSERWSLSYYLYIAKGHELSGFPMPFSPNIPRLVNQKEFDMKKMARVAATCGISLSMAAQAQAASHLPKHAVKHARIHIHHLYHRLTADPLIVAGATKFCYYMGGPHGTSWVCR
jgi:hypothetical protein